MTEEQTKFLYSIADNIGTTGIEDFTYKDGEKMREIIKALEQQPSDDCVSRQATLNAIIKELCIKDESYLLQSEKVIYNVVKNMSPVTPTRRKGKWIEVLGGCKCPFCDMAFSGLKGWCSDNFCPECGADMRGNENG